MGRLALKSVVLEKRVEERTRERGKEREREMHHFSPLLASLRREVVKQSKPSGLGRPAGCFTVYTRTKDAIHIFVFKSRNISYQNLGVRGTEIGKILFFFN